MRSISTAILSSMAVTDVIVILSGVISVLDLVLVHDSHCVEHHIASQVSIEHGVDTVELTIFDKFSNGEWVGVTTSDQADTIDC